jgi:hypothetical protein
MRIEWRRLARDETNYELIVGVFALPLVVAAALLAGRLPSGVAPVCWFYHATGIPCPACGSWTCLQNLVRGRVHEAWLASPLATACVFLATGYMLCSWTVVLFRLPRLRIEMTKSGKWAIAAAATVAVLANWAYLILTSAR